MMNHMYLSGKAKTVSVQSNPTCLTLIEEYLRCLVGQGAGGYTFTFDDYWCQNSDQFKTFGAVRLEILFYEKTVPDKGREHVLLYGIAENSRFQLQSFTISYNTCWLNDQNQYPEDRYFDSVIISGHGTPHILTGSSSEVSIYDRQGKIIGRCITFLRFTSETNDKIPPRPVDLECSLNSAIRI